MQKFYSIVLMAVALLVGTNVNATTVADIQAAIDGAAVGATVNIQLNSPVEFATTDAPIRIYAKKAEAGKIVNLDLNGYTISALESSKRTVLIELFKGTLNISNGTIINEGGSQNSKGAWTSATIKVYGSEDRDAVNWSVLNIGEEASIQNTKKEAIAVYGFYGKAVYRYLNSGASAYTGMFLDGTPMHYYDEYDSYLTKKQGTTVKVAADAFAAENLDYSTSFPEYKTTATSKGYYDFSTTLQKAYGVNITVDGTVHGHEYGIKINGNVSSARQAATDQMPYVHITSTGKVSCDANYSEGTAVYSSGYGKWDIEGYVVGNIGVTIKSGEVSITDAVIESNSTCAHENYTSSNSGVTGGQGSAILVVSDAAYKGEQTVTISGDTRVSSTNGFAIEEVITDKVEETTKVSQIKIEGGTFEGGAEGAMRFENNTVNEDKVSIYGGNVEGNVHIGTADDKLSELIPTGSHITEVVVDDKTTLVVSEGTAPTGYPTVADHAGESVKWTGSAEPIAADLILKELEITEDKAQVLTVKTGVKLTVDRVILGGKAQIIVEAGAMLLVKGEQGIVAPKTSNIVLKTSESAQALFLFNPAVTSNRHPNATVEFTSKGYYKSDTDYGNQRFGIPTHEALTEVTAKYAGEDVGTGFGLFNGSSWVAFGYINVPGKTMDYSKMATPFAYYQMQHNTPNMGTIVTMKGELVGNDSPVFAIKGSSWNGFANSFMAPIDGETLINLIPNTVQKAFYLYDLTADQATWDVVTLAEIDNIRPLQPFLIRNTKAGANVTVDYTNAVYNPTVTPSNSSAPARRIANNWTKAKLIVKGENCIDRVTVVEGEEFSAEFDNGYDAVKYMNDGINMYVTSDEKMGILATDNLENTYVGFQTVKGGTYTIDFTKVQGNDLTLVDLVTGARVAMVEGNVYEFTAAANTTNDYRFQIVGSHNAPTAVDNVSAANSGAVYTIMGQYVGEMSDWNILPAGIYVVDGVKRVK